MRVQLTRVVSPLIFALVLPFAIARPSAGVEFEEQQAGLRFELFTDSDAVHVYTSGGNYDLKLSNAATLAVGWNHELVIVPGVSAPPGSQEAVDSISGASRRPSATTASSARQPG
jgi:hypothetical protein